MENKKAIYFIGVIVLIILGIFYFNNNNEVKTEVKTESKTEVQKTETKVEVENNATETKADVNKTKDTKSKETNSSDPETVYKNTPENEGINMVLKVPEKWSHLDYSKLGQLEENISEIKADIEFKYLKKESEKKLIKLYLNKDFRDLVSKFYDDESMERRYRAKKIISGESYEKDIETYGHDYVFSDENLADITGYIAFDDFFSDINNLISIDEKTGGKYANDEIANFFDYFCSKGNAYQTGCRSTYEKRIEKGDSIIQELTKDEYLKVKEFLLYYEETLNWY